MQTITDLTKEAWPQYCAFPQGRFCINFRDQKKDQQWLKLDQVKIRTVQDEYVPAGKEPTYKTFNIRLDLAKDQVRQLLELEQHIQRLVVGRKLNGLYLDAATLESRWQSCIVDNQLQIKVHEDWTELFDREGKCIEWDGPKFQSTWPGVAGSALISPYLFYASESMKMGQKVYRCGVSFRLHQFKRLGASVLADRKVADQDQVDDIVDDYDDNHVTPQYSI